MNFDAWLTTDRAAERGARLQSFIERTPSLDALQNRVLAAQTRVVNLETRALSPHPYGKRLAHVTDWAKRRVLYLERELEGAIEEACEPPDPPDREDD